MNIHDKSKELQRRRGYNHPNQQAGWKDNSYHASRTLEEANYLGDEEYHHRLGVHNPLWRYIINRYHDEAETPLIVLGWEALPLAIELSQWTYPVSLIVKDAYEIKKAESDAKRQAGTFQIITTNIEECKPSRVAIFIGLTDDFTSDKEVKKFVTYLLKGVKEVVFAVAKPRNYQKMFGRNLVDSIRYNGGKWRLLRVN